MARKRMIDPNIWQSEDFASLSVLARLVFIGMFSNADDYGKGRAKAVYLKSIIFPYDEAIKVSDIAKALSEIEAKMAVTFYTSDGNQYYRMDNWNKWQKVEKPSISTIPDPAIDTFPERSGNNRGSVDEQSRLIEEKRKEEKGRENNNTRARVVDDFSPELEKTVDKYPPIEQQVSDYTQDTALKEALLAFVTMRKKTRNKQPLTEYAFFCLLHDLDKLATAGQSKLDIVNYAVSRGWSGFYAVPSTQPRGKPSQAVPLSPMVGNAIDYSQFFK